MSDHSAGRRLAIAADGKVLLLALFMVCATALVIAGKATWSEIDGPVLLLVGYATGNGITAWRGGTPRALIEPGDRRRRQGDE